MNIGLGIPGAYEAITVADSAIGPTLADLTTAELADRAPVSAALLTVETAAVRFRVDGGTPTSSVGHELVPGESFWVYGHSAVENLLMIRTTATSASVKVTYFFG